MARQELIDTSKDILLKNFEILTSSIDDDDRKKARDLCLKTINECYEQLGHYVDYMEAAYASQTSENEAKTDSTIEFEEDTVIDEKCQNEALNDATSDVNNSSQIEEDDSPKYAVFYSLNHAAYIALDETLKCCMIVRNLAKAYCVEADVTGIANGQNELSKYNLEKFKPLQIKFLTQKEYDDTIGRAKSMADLIVNMPKVENTEISSEHKVANFATNTKSTTKAKPNVSHNYHSHESDKPKKFDWFHNKPYENKSNNPSDKNIKKITLTDKLENPVQLYATLHHRIDRFNANGMTSYDKDFAQIATGKLNKLDDFDELIPLLNETLERIAITQSAWLLDGFYKGLKTRYLVDEINNDYLMDIDYSIMDSAIARWNHQQRPSKSGYLMYVEEFDPTIASFKKNIKEAAKKFVRDEEEMAAKAIYNYVRCLIAYEEYVYAEKAFACNT